MNITFLGQGFEHKSPNSVGNNLIKLFKDKKFNSFTAISAFASESGILNIKECIAKSPSKYNSIKIIVGVDQEGTSLSALEAILELKVTSYIFYQKESPIFHPKIYLFEGQNDFTLIVGSSNLTGRGLFANVESSIMIEGTLATDSEPLNQLKDYYSGLFNLSDPNLFEITTENIKRFVDEGIVPTKATWKKKHAKKTSKSKPKSGSGLVVPKRKTAKIPITYQGNSTTDKIVEELIDELEIGNYFEQPKASLLVWKKESLSKSDAQIVPAGTAPTGNVKLAQAKFEINGSVVDQKTYFRNTVFSSLNWVNAKSGNNSYEETNADFEVIIKGKKIGDFSLKLSHDSNRISGQGNTPTWLHWGRELTSVVRKNNLTDSTFNLYKDGNNFIIEVL